jgi:predicted XRE-type DNA-binding protein
MQKCSKKDGNKPEKPWIEGSGNIYKDLGFGDEEAANLLVRGNLILQVRQIIQEKGWNQEQAAKALRVKQPRIAEIMGLKTQCFSVDLLLKYLARLGKRVDMVVRDANDVA